jgi:fumarate hydratase class II
MGEVKVPSDAYYGAQTARAVDNFPISTLRFSRRFIRALGLIKKHAAAANEALGLLPHAMASAIQQAAQEVIDGKWDSQFVVDVFQTGSGTSTNMNANEVIANRAIELFGGQRGDKSKIHPNDHVNRGQSSNDVIPSAIHLAALDAITIDLVPALQELHRALEQKAQEFHDVIKIGRTHLQDATPIRLGQEFSGYASQIEHGIERLKRVTSDLAELALGGTAVGTGINTHPEFARRVIDALSRELKLELREAANHFEAQGARDGCVQTSGTLRTVAISLMKIADDIRLLASGPRCGLGELKLPATQPGSSIMPGKVNPVICEMMMQVGAQVVGHDAAIAFAGGRGHLELNTMMPIIAYDLLESIDLLTNAARVFARRCITGLAAEAELCRANLERSLAAGTALAAVIGYDKAAHIVHVAYESGRTVREVAFEISGLSQQQVEELLEPARQTDRAADALRGCGN